MQAYFFLDGFALQLDAVFNGLEKFIGGAKIDDDITSVVIKMQNQR